MTEDSVEETKFQKLYTICLCYFFIPFHLGTNQHSVVYYVERETVLPIATDN